MGKGERRATEPVKMTGREREWVGWGGGREKGREVRKAERKEEGG